MTTVTMQLPDELCRQAEAQASERGATLDELMQEALEGYLADLQEVSEAEEILARIRSGEEPSISWEEYQALDSPEDQEDVIAIIAAKRAIERGEDEFFDLEEIQAELNAIQG